MLNILICIAIVLFPFDVSNFITAIINPAKSGFMNGSQASDNKYFVGYNSCVNINQGWLYWI